MARDRRPEQEDDGRTIVDMSQVERPTGFGFRGDLLPERRRERPQERKPGRPWENSDYTPKERRMYALGALKAALLIGIAYLAGLALVIFLLLQLWG